LALITDKPKTLNDFSAKPEALITSKIQHLLNFSPLVIRNSVDERIRTAPAHQLSLLCARHVKFTLN
jgi:hypothetical protein